MGVNLFPGIEKPTTRDRLGAELADEQLKMILTLRKIRIDRGMTVAEVAEFMKVDPAQVSRLESGATNPTWATIRRYAKAVEAIIRIDTRRWSDEQTKMVQRSVEALKSKEDAVVDKPGWTSSPKADWRGAPEPATSA